ncbi:MAG: hypothetical protein H0U74_02130 [Bradymonadaceae bacterium]|nr:hypothetical protein [Lujinxingiaceae bacterium]
MADESKEGTEETKASEKIMCFISKQMVAIEQTVEIEYQGHKRVRVLPKYIKYDQAVAG